MNINLIRPNNHQNKLQVCRKINKISIEETTEFLQIGKTLNLENLTSEKKVKLANFIYYASMILRNKINTLYFKDKKYGHSQNSIKNHLINYYMDEFKCNTTESASALINICCHTNTRKAGFKEFFTRTHSLTATAERIYTEIKRSLSPIEQKKLISPQSLEKFFTQKVLEHSDANSVSFLHEINFEEDMSNDQQLLDSLPLFSISNLQDKTQNKIVDAIYKQSLGLEKETLLSIAEILATTTFTNDVAQLKFANIIYEQKLGCDLKVLNEIAKSLAKIKLTNPKAQEIIAKAIAENKLGVNERTQNIIAESLATMSFTSELAQNIITEAICNDRLGTHYPIKLTIAKSLAQMTFTSQQALLKLTTSVLIAQINL